jgi:hypothetical protein
MDFVKLSLDGNYGNYSDQESSSMEMEILGLFFSSDVGCSREGSPTYAEWALQDKWGTIFSGNTICVEKEDNYIFLSDVLSEEEVPTKVKISPQQFVDIIDEWFNKVCKNKPKKVIIKHENNQFFIETYN